jgi:ligand-binding sensor domain-containing protein
MKSSSAGISILLILLLPLSWIGVENIDAQEYTVKKFTTQTGLSHNNVRAILRDSTGFIWLATWDGLSRFDGYNFRNYYHVPNDSASLSYFSVRQITLDKDNNLWVLTDLKLLEKYDRASDKFSIVREIAGIRLEDVSMINTDSAGNLIILNENHIIKWNEKIHIGTLFSIYDNTGKDYKLNTAFLSNLIFTGDELWLSGPSVLHFRKQSDKRYYLVKEYQIENPIKKRIEFDFTVWYNIYISPNGSKWIFSNTGLFRFDEESGLFRQQKPFIPKGEFVGKDLFLWGDFYDGIYIYDSENQELKHIPPKETGFPIALLPDADNTIWFSCVSPAGVPQGLSHVVFTSGFFRNYLITAPDSTQPAVYALAIDDNRNTWVGIRGLDYLVKIESNGISKQVGRLTNELSELAGHVRSMSVTSDGIWIGYYLKLLRFYSFSDRKFSNFFPGSDACRTILTHNQKVYIATNEVKVFNPSTGKTGTLWRSHTSLSTYKLYPDTGNIIWCAMAKGTIAKLDISNGEGRLIIVPPGQSNTEDIIRDSNGNLWLAFLGDGVCRYDPESGTTKYYTTQNGLSNNTTYNLMEDRSGYIWVSTNNGISRINPLTDQIRTFGLSDGLKIHEFNSGAKFRTEDGEFLLGGMGGFVRFYPETLSTGEKSGLKQKIIFTGFEVSGIERSLPESLNESDTIILKPGENNFHITFSSSDFKNAENTRYRYSLSGVNDGWILTSSYNRNLSYSNLKPGFHTLSIEANNINGNWTVTRKLTIRIKPYFFQTRGFRIAMPTFIILLLMLLIITYIRQVRNKERQKQETLKLQTLQGQMNPHFIFNSLNSINYFISNNDKLSANRYIADFARLIRSILHNMNHSYITLEKEIESVEDYLKIEYLRFGDKFDYKVFVDSEIKPEEIKVSPGMVQPFVENAIWHGVRGLENRKGIISVKFRLKEGKLICEIEDDGIGRKRSNEMKSKNDQKKSKGISIITERLRILSNLHNNNYQVSIMDPHPERNETGTRVVIDLPVEKP